MTLDEIEASVKEYANAEIEFTKVAEAKEYRETINLLERLNAVVEPISLTQSFPASLLD